MSQSLEDALENLVSPSPFPQIQPEPGISMQQGKEEMALPKVNRNVYL